MTNNYRFYDTCSLLLRANNLFDVVEQFAISSITLEELENIKTSSKKDADTKYAANKLLHLLDDHMGEFDIHVFNETMLQPIIDNHLTITNDMKILATALDFYKLHKDLLFVSNDLSLRTIAVLFFPQEQIAIVAEEDDNYTGYIDITLSDEELENFYSYSTINHFEAFINEYLIIRNQNGNIVDRKVWTGDCYRSISFENFDSKQFGRIKPLDVQQ